MPRTDRNRAVLVYFDAEYSVRSTGYRRVKPCQYECMSCRIFLEKKNMHGRQALLTRPRVRRTKNAIDDF